MTRVFAYIPQAPKTALEAAALVGTRGPAWTQEQIDQLTELVEDAEATAANLSTVLTRTTTTTAASGQTIAADTTAAPWTLTLPAGGGIVTVIRRGANPLTIAGNGRTIDGAATDATIPENMAVTFRAASSDAAWSYAYGA